MACSSFSSAAAAAVRFAIAAVVVVHHDRHASRRRVEVAIYRDDVEEISCVLVDRVRRGRRATYLRHHQEREQERNVAEAICYQER